MANASPLPNLEAAKIQLLIIHDVDSPAPVRRLLDFLSESQPSMQVSEATSAEELERRTSQLRTAAALAGGDVSETPDGRADIVIISEAVSWTDCFTLCRNLKDSFSHLPVLLLASTEPPEKFAQPGFWNQVWNAGFTECLLPNPHQQEELMQGILRAWERGRQSRTELLGEVSSRELAERLRVANESLVKEIAERTRVAEKRASQLRILAGELTKAEERERRRLAQMLHDDLQQMLVAARMHISAIPSDASPSRFSEALGHVDDLLDRSIRLSRNLTVRFSPPILYDAGLAPALEWLGRQVEEEHGLEVEVDCDDTAQPEALDTRVLLYQAVRELLFNVVKHAGVPRAKVSMHHAGEGDTQVSVCDEGKGFDPDVLSSTDALHSGFGLFSIRERLELIRGRMEIESIEGEGACVRLFAPLRMTDEERMSSQNMQNTLLALDDEQQPVPKKSRDIDPIRVLLADDHRIMRASLAGLLRTQPGIEVIGQAADGHEVIEMARSLRPDVIVMDITMPVVDGVEATRTLTRELPTVFIIGLSMHEKEDMQRAMRDAGAARYLTKDGPPELLIAAIRSSLRDRLNRRSP